MLPGDWNKWPDDNSFISSSHEYSQNYIDFRVQSRGVKGKETISNSK